MGCCESLWRELSEHCPRCRECRVRTSEDQFDSYVWRESTTDKSTVDTTTYTRPHGDAHQLAAITKVSHATRCKAELTFSLFPCVVRVVSENMTTFLIQELSEVHDMEVD